MKNYYVERDTGFTNLTINCFEKYYSDKNFQNLIVDKPDKDQQITIKELICLLFSLPLEEAFISFSISYLKSDFFIPVYRVRLINPFNCKYPLFLIGKIGEDKTRCIRLDEFTINQIYNGNIENNVKEILDEYEELDKKIIVYDKTEINDFC